MIIGYRVGRASSRAVSSWPRWPGGCGFRGVFWVGRFFYRFFLFLFLMRQGRGSEATEAVFCLLAKKPLDTGVRTGCHYLIGLSVCLSVCV